MHLADLTVFFLLLFIRHENVFSMEDKYIEVSTYSGYKVIWIEPKDKSDLEKFVKFCDGECDVWSSNQVLVTPKKWNDLKTKWEKFKMEIIVDDVQRLLDTEDKTGRVKRSDNSGVSWDDYLSFDQINSHTTNITSNSSFISVESIGKSFEGKEIQLVKICWNKPCGRKPAIWLDGGAHAREWISPVALLYIVNQLRDTKESVLKKFDWYILPLMNPDGYIYSQKSKRFWRKTRTSHCGRGCTCKGVDLNRNFPFQWNGTNGDSSSNSCHPNYRGPSALSDPESKVVHDFLWQNRKNIQLSISIHSYGQVILLPHTHTTEKVKNFDQLEQKAKAGTDAMKEVSGAVYKVGLSNDLMGYMADGTLLDWVYSEAGIRFAYILELRPSLHKGSEYRGVVGFLLDKSEILPAAKEAWAFVKRLASVL